MMMTTRRTVIAGAAALAAVPAFAQRVGPFDRIRAETGGRLGVAVYDSGTGRRFSDGAEARFAMCSTFKAYAAAAILQQGGSGSCVFIFCLPGSTNACRLAWNEIIRHQLNRATKPCNLATLKPRLHER